MFVRSFSIQHWTRSSLLLAVVSVSATAASIVSAQEAEGEPSEPPKVSFFREVRPILQEHCQGCHQPAKRGGDYVLTDFAALGTPGESEEPVVVPGDPDSSNLIVQIVPRDGNAAMPKDKPPLHEEQIEVLRRWIEQGAEDDTPLSNQVTIDAEHPPVYTQPPVVTSVAVAPQGDWLAVSGYHEVLLFAVNAGAEENTIQVDPTPHRLVGLSERIESIAFSPDGQRLAVAGGSPGRFGELQIWDLATERLTLSKIVGFDTLYGASWSPDGQMIAFGCPDKTIRGVSAESGEQLLFSGVHDDWVLDTVFSTAGDHVISVSRDRSMKLVNVPTQRFIDNITSITPGALKGGLAAVDRHPTADQLLCGGADGVPKLYRMLREQERRIGDDFNLIRAFPEIEGRINDVTFDASGERIAVCSSLDGHGRIRVHATADGATQLDVAVPESGLYSLDFAPDGSWVVTAGFDGRVRIFRTADGQTLAQFPATPTTNASDAPAPPASE